MTSKESNKKKKTRSHGKSESNQIQTSPVVVGKIYADWCGHCINLKPIWAELKDKMKHTDNHFVFVEIEENQMKGGVEKINTEYLEKSTQKLELQGGFPTIFKIQNGQLEYYNNNRDLPSLTNWLTGVKGGDKMEHTNNKKNIHRKKSGLMDRAFFYFFGGKTVRKSVRKNNTKKVRFHKNK